MKLSIVVPTHNEQTKIAQLFEQLRAISLKECNEIDSVEVIIVDNASSDETFSALENEMQKHPLHQIDQIPTQIFLHKLPLEMGKGAAVKTGIDESHGGVVLIHNGDFETRPDYYSKLINPITQDQADAVYGSRNSQLTLFDRILLFISNLLSGFRLTDREAGLKTFKGQLIRSLHLKTIRTEIEPELTAKISKANGRLIEVPIPTNDIVNSTSGNGLTLIQIIRFHLFDRKLYKPGMNAALMALDQTAEIIYHPLLLRAVKDQIQNKKPLRILEIGSGIGSISKLLVELGDLTASDMSQRYVDTLKDRFKDRSNFSAFQWDASKAPPKDIGKFDLIVSFNVLEHIEDHESALSIWRDLLVENGQLVVLVPNNPWLYAPIDKLVGHYRRYTKESMRQLTESTRLETRNFFYGNAIGILGWLVFAKLLKCYTISDGSLRLYKFIKLAFGPIERFIEKYTGLSLIVVTQPRR